MQSLALTAPWGFESFHIREVSEPMPAPGEARVRMKAISLNYRDLLIASGRHVHGALGANDIIPFGEGCGVVDAVGEDVTSVVVGDRVIPAILPRWECGSPTVDKMSGALGLTAPGLGQEYITAPETALIKAPDFLTDAEAACLACAGLTAWSALFNGPRLKPGNVVLVQGTGGVSLAAMLFAKAAGFETIVTSSSDAKLEKARAYGADHGINYLRETSWSAPAREITAGRGVDLVLEMGGKGTLEESLSAIRLNGHIAMVGMLDSGSTIPPAKFLASAARMHVVSVGSTAMLEEMCRAVAQHRIRPIISETFDWKEAPEALKALQAGDHFGKIVLTF